MSLAPEPNADDPLEHALACAAAGIRCLPIKPGHKRPPMASWQHAATTNPDTIRNWYRGLYGGHGVGLAMGTQPDGRNLFALDIDEHDANASGFETIAELERLHGKLPPSVASITGNRGAHVIYDSGDVVVTNGAAGAVGPGVDVRGEGGQIVVAPSVHPNGSPYAWEHGFAPWEIEVAPAPAWLLELVAPPEPEPVKPAPPAPIYETDSPADTLRNAWDWHTELERRGWQQARRPSSNGDTHWTRPGKDPREGASAVLHADGPLVVFTTDASTMPMWRAGKQGNGCVSLSPLAYVAAYDHAGDLSAATRALRAAQPIASTLGSLVAPSAQGEAADEASAIEATVDDEWHPTNLAEIAGQIAAGTRQRVTPTLLQVDGAMPLLYRGRVHSIFGAPGGGKTWIALAAIAEQLQAGEHVLFIDWEDSADGTAARLLDLGCTLDDIGRLDYISPSTSLALGIGALLQLGAAQDWALIVIDSAGEAMATAGIDPNADGQVATWMALAKSLTTLESAPTVLMLDHIPKNSETPAGFAIGSQRKLAAITGAAYRCDTMVEPAIGKPGKLKLVVAKDRLGNRPKGSTAAEAHFAPADEAGALHIRFAISEAQAAHERGERFRPTVLMERVSRWLELNPGASTKQIREAVSGRNEGIDAALVVLLEEAWVTSEMGARNARLYTSARPYRELDDALSGEQTGDLAHLAPPRPDLAPGEVAHLAHLAPPPLGGARSEGRHAGHSETTTSPRPGEVIPAIDRTIERTPLL